MFKMKSCFVKIDTLCFKDCQSLVYNLCLHELELMWGGCDRMRACALTKTAFECMGTLHICVFLISDFCVCVCVCALSWVQRSRRLIFRTRDQVTH